MTVTIDTDTLIGTLGNDWFIGMFFMHGDHEYKILGTNGVIVELLITRSF